MQDVMDLVKVVRNETGLSLKDCKEAAQHALEKNPKANDKELLALCVDFLRSKGRDKAMKKGSRVTAEGFFGHYVHHNGKIAVVVEVNCETDFVARNDKFQKFIKDISMHIAGTSPAAIKPEDIAPEVVEKEKQIYKAQLVQEGKPEAAHTKIIEGKLNAFYRDNCLLQQPMLGDAQNRTVQQILDELIVGCGENVVVRRFLRWELGK